MKNTTTIVLSCTVFLLAACRKDHITEVPSKAHYFQVYEVTYDKTSNSTFITAEFRKNDYLGERMQLSKDEYITVDGMLSNTTSKAGDKVYAWQFDGLDDHFFKLVKADDTIENWVAYSDVSKVDFDSRTPDVASKKEGINVRVVGYEPNGRNEIYLGTFSGPVGREILVSSYSIYLSPKDLEVFNPGKMQLTLRNKLIMQLNEEDSSKGGLKQITLNISKDIQLNAN